ncbi:SPOR domain-containing protein [Nitrosovibrio sp. Nv6]|uniref:SPOR domain-containing protein n=1 Tax=Nitrosovibrio sp. Nv6 TaxID=1855340 RepID=UPI0008C5286F|nr:SPOR domain-containing protein [Nitrosovibrio sp. Nv6]SEP25079.1 Cell division protein FtsN [Nitrosovibrio sp. Nv6]
MSRDYKTHPNSSFPGKNGNTLLLGLFIGYALGLLTAIGTWMYINQAPSPFISQDKLADSPAANGAIKQTEKGIQVSGADAKPAKADGKPRFEFYKILPGTEEPVTDQQLKQAAQQPSTQDKYFLQAGSFQNADDADNLKARLAMLGVEASVQAADLPEKGIWHRVRVGPFTSIDDIDRIRASLRQNGVQSSLIKTHEGVR